MDTSSAPAKPRGLPDVDQSLMLPEGRTRSRKRNYTDVTNQGDSDEETEDTLDDEWVPPLRFQRESARKPGHITLSLPAKTLPSVEMPA